MGSALHRSFFRGMVVGGLQLSSPVTLSRNGWVATVFTGHSFEEWVGSALHRSLFRGIGVWGLQALWSLGVFRRVMRPCRPLLACPEIPLLLPLPRAIHPLTLRLHHCRQATTADVHPRRPAPAAPPPPFYRPQAPASSPAPLAPSHYRRSHLVTHPYARHPHPRRRTRGGGARPLPPAPATHCPPR